MAKHRSIVLPIAILLGFIFHNLCVKGSFLVPFLLFFILSLNYVAVDLRHLRFTKMHLWILLFQVFMSICAYGVAKYLTHNNIIAQALLMGILCPVASSVVVVSTMLGGDKTITTSYTIICNIVVSIVAPLYFTFIGVHSEYHFITSFWRIFCKIAPTIALPFFVVLVLQKVAPRTNEKLSKYQYLSFYLWAVALFLTIGKTISYIIHEGPGNEHIIVILGVLSAILCTVHFAFGKWLGSKYNDRIAGGQLLGQKNTAMGIWMANVYLEPLSSVLLAFYIILQNLFNSYQIWRHEKRANEQIL